MTSEGLKTRTRTWHGPPSLLGVAIGLLVTAMPYVGLVSRDSAWVIALPPLLGVVLLPFPGTGRQLGVGLVASAVALPAVVLSFVVLGLFG